MKYKWRCRPFIDGEIINVPDYTHTINIQNMSVPGYGASIYWLEPIKTFEDVKADE